MHVHIHLAGEVVTVPQLYSPGGEIVVHLFPTFTNVNPTSKRSGVVQTSQPWSFGFWFLLGLFFFFLDKMSSPSVQIGENVNYMQLYVCTGTRITDRHYLCTGTRITDRHYVCTGTRMTDRHYFCTGTRITDRHYVCTGTRLTDRHYVCTGTRITDRHYVCTGTRITDCHYINEYY